MNNRDIIRAESELDMIKDKSRETDMLAKENLELRSRINKAIDYINEMCLFSDGYASYGDDLRPEHIVDILKGEDNE